MRALVLGVTPELVTLAWPPGSTVTAVDREPAMIAAHFTPAPGREAVCGDWLALPAGDGAFDVVVGDGCASTLAYPAGYGAFAAELARALAPGGLAILRLFAAPERAETLADVAADLAAGPAPATVAAGFDALKWRVAMAAQPPDRNVRVADIRAAFDELVPDRAALAARTGWRREVIDHIDAYRGSDAVYSFPTLAEARAAFAPWLETVACHAPSYPLGERCPTVVLRRAER